MTTGFVIPNVQDPISLPSNAVARPIIVRFGRGNATVFVRMFSSISDGDLIGFGALIGFITGTQRLRLRAALEAGREAAMAGIIVKDANHHSAIQPATTEGDPALTVLDAVERQMLLYAKAVIRNYSGVEPHDADPSELARLAITIVELEGPIHVEEIARRTATSFGRERAGARIFAATKAALTHAQRLASHLTTEESFWQTRGQLESPPVRDRSAEDGATTKATKISLLEIRAAIRIAREDNAGGDEADLIRTAARLLGFRRVGSELQARLVQGLRNC